MLKSDQRPKITVEDLLHLKRAERPAPEFWANFESELRQKQLTALLEKRSWWQELPQVFARRAYLPVGATAILAFTLVSIRYSTPTQLTQAGDTAPATPAFAVNRPTAAPIETLASAPVTSPLINRSKESVPRVEVVARVAETPEPALTDESMASMITPAATIETPSSRYIATNLDRLERTDPDLVRAVIGNHLSAPARVQTASLAMNELATVPTSISRRNRILAQYSYDRSLNPEPTAPELVRERLARRLGDSDISDRISRIGLKGDQVSLGLTLRL